MSNAVSRAYPTEQRIRTTDTPTGRLRVTVSAAGVDALAAYEALCRRAVFSPTQGPVWVRAWLEGERRDGLIAILSREDRPVMALALEVETRGRFRIARFAGRSHANGNFPVLADAVEDPKAAMEALVAAIREARPDIDMLALERQRMRFEGFDNPILALGHAQSPDVALAIDLTGGFEAVLARAGKRKRKKHRQQARKFEAAGGYRHFEAENEQAVDTLLDAFFALKRKSLRKRGLGDVFAPQEVRASFRKLFHAALHEEGRSFALQGLEVDGKLRAVTGASRTRDTTICDFSAFADDELAYLSPGEFLSHENVAMACAQGFAVYDFSVGDEPYKRSWCDIETTYADTVVGLTPRGRALAAFQRALGAVKRTVKRHPAVAALARKVRRIASRGRVDDVT